MYFAFKMQNLMDIKKDKKNSVVDKSSINVHLTHLEKGCFSKGEFVTGEGK